jgi:hypothetical protein
MGQAFWLSVLLLTLGIQLCYLPIIKWYGGSSTDAGILTITAVIMPLVYLLGICGTIFNREHDNQTFGWLETSTIRPSQLWLGKITFALLSSLALLAVLMIALPLTAWFARITLKPIGEDYGFGVREWSVVFCLVAGLGLICSQVIKQPMAATFAAGALVFGVSMMWGWQDGTWSNEELVRMASLGCCLVAFSYLATPTWLHGSARAPAASSEQGLLSKRWRVSPIRELSAGRRRRIGVRVLWAIRRRQWMHWLLPLVLPLLLLGIAALSAAGPSLLVDQLFVWIAAVAVLAPIIVGGTTFDAESSATHRQFLVDRGAGGREMWWLRIGSMVIYAALLGSLLVGIAILSMPPLPKIPDELLVMMKHYIMYAALTFSAAQYFSLCIRSQLISVFVTILCAATFGYWVSIGWEYRIAASVIVLPALGFLVGAWWRAPDWLISETRVKRWILPIAIPLLGLVITYGALYANRVSSIPPASPGYDVAAFQQEVREQYRPAPASVIDTAAARVSTLLNEEVQEFYASDPNKLARALAGDGIDVPQDAPKLDMKHIWKLDPGRYRPEGWDELFRLLTPQVAAAAETAHGLTNLNPDNDPSNRSWFPTDFRETSHLILAYSTLARWHSHHGRPEATAEAFHTALMLCQQKRRNGFTAHWLAAAELERMLLENIVLWSASGDVSQQQMREMVAWLNDYWQADPSWSTFVKVDHLRALWLIDSFTDVHPVQLWMPGERQRLQRVADWSVRPEVMNWIQQSEKAGRQGNHRLPPFPLDGEQALYRTEKNTGIDLMTYVIQHPSMVQGTAEQLVRLEVARGATELRLLLLAEKSEHGELPTAQGDLRVPPAIRQQAVRSPNAEEYEYRWLPENLNKVVSIDLFPQRYAVRVDGWVIEHGGIMFPLWE